MNHGTSRLAGLAGICMGMRLGAVDAGGVDITRRGDAMHVATANYAATVDADGALTSLKVRGKEFLKARRGNPRGIYLYQHGPLALKNVAQSGPAAIEARNDRAEVRYEFDARTVTWTVKNRTADKMLCLIVFDPGVTAVANAAGEYEKTPTQQSWQTTTWFRGERKLEVTGGSRIWGPWAEGLQVWEAAVAPKSTHTVVLTAGAATAGEVGAAAAALAYTARPPTDPDGPMWDLARLSVPPAVHPAKGFEADGVRALFFEAPPYRGRPTRVFAWVGVPAVESGKKVPGMVLVHGGGGTAFAEWVQLWNRRGYAAIAMDTCGCTPGGTHGHRPRHKFGGPPGWGGFSQIDWPRTDQWTWHAVADVILAHSLLRSLPGVDPDRIGLTGISWGGYLTCIVAGVDPRFRFAVPVYGCGFTNEHAFAARVNSLGPERAARWMRWWDPSVYLPEARMPMLWVDGTNDFAYTLNALQKSYRLPRGPRTLCVRIRMPHSQGAGQAPEEIALFADALLRGGAPLTRFMGQGREGRRVWATFESSVAVEKAELIFTRDTGKWQDRFWDSAPAELDVGAQRISARLPDGTACWFLNLTDRRGAVVSTEHEEIRR